MSSSRPRVLIVDDEVQMAEMVADGLKDHGYDSFHASSGRDAVARLESERVDALVTDLRMPDLDGMELLSASHRLDPGRPVIVMTAFGAIDTAIESIRKGAYHYLTKPFRLEELVIFLGRALDESRVRREAEALRAELRDRFSGERLVASSQAMREVLDIVGRVARTDTPVLLTGETGTGKGLVARAIHGASPRAKGPFVAVNCAALPETLLESELFGHVRGAFTGATRDRAGLFAEADGGTLLLDEIGEMPMALQAKLLHVLESRTVRPVGASREQPVDVRIVAATHRDLPERVRAGAFREDLLYRIDVVPVHLPPLRERGDDVPRLVEDLLKEAKGRHPGSVVERLSPEAMATLLDYPWPGNVRELAHVMERLVILGSQAEVAVSDLPGAVREGRSAPAWPRGEEIVPVREVQRRYAAWALSKCGGRRGLAAERLGIDPKTLSKWLDDIDEPGAAGKAEGPWPLDPLT